MARSLGLDIGERYIGVAVSDEGGLISEGIKTIKRKDIESHWQEGGDERGSNRKKHSRK